MAQADRRLLDLATSIADGTTVDWDGAERAASADERSIVLQLRCLSEIGHLHRTWPRLSEDDGQRQRGGQEPEAIERWGHLEILEKVGEGSFGEVFRARDTILDREVALKLLYRGERSRAQSVIREGRLLAKVKHPNVVTVYGADEHDGRAGMWMEFIRGKTLAMVLRENGPMSAHESATVGLQLSHALAEVHRVGVIHRDIKAQNIMREEGGRLVLMDFGVGQAAAPWRQADSISGTPLYLAPEVLEGQPASGLSDLYSMGVLLYFLVTGELPILARTISELKTAHRSGRINQLADCRPNLPSAFTKIVAKASATDASQRHETAGVLASALQGFLQDEHRPALSKARLGVTLTAAALILLSLAYGIFRSLDDRSNATQASVEGQQRLNNAEALHKRGELTAALVQLELAVESSPNFPSAYSLMSIIQSGLGQLEEAFESSRRAFELRHNAPSHERFAIAANFYRDCSQFTKAEAAHRLAAQSGVARDLRLLSQARATLPLRIRDAIEPARQACAADPADALNCGWLGVVLAEANRPHDSLGAIREVRQSFGDHPYFSWAEGIALLELERFEAANQAFEKLKQGGPIYRSHASLFQARTASARGQLDRAIGIAAREHTLDLQGKFRRNDLDRALFLARLHLLAQDPATSLRLLEPFETLPATPSILLRLRNAAVALARSKQHERASGLLRKIQEIDASYPSLLSESAVAQVQGELARALGELDEAAHLMRQAASRWPDWLVLESLALLQAELGDASARCRSLDGILDQKGLIWARDLPTFWLRSHQQFSLHCESWEPRAKTTTGG